MLCTDTRAETAYTDNRHASDSASDEDTSNNLGNNNNEFSHFETAKPVDNGEDLFANTVVIPPAPGQTRSRAASMKKNNPDPLALFGESNPGDSGFGDDAWTTAPSTSNNAVDLFGNPQTSNNAFGNDDWAQPQPTRAPAQPKPVRSQQSDLIDLFGPSPVPAQSSSSKQVDLFGNPVQSQPSTVNDNSWSQPQHKQQASADLFDLFGSNQKPGQTQPQPFTSNVQTTQVKQPVSSSLASLYAMSTPAHGGVYGTQPMMMQPQGNMMYQQQQPPMFQQQQPMMMMQPGMQPMYAQPQQQNAFGASQPQRRW